MENMLAYIKESADYIRSHTRYRPEVAIILGTGLGQVADMAREADVIPYTDIPHFKGSTAPYHAGRLVVGKIGESPVFIMQGRHHLYEGYTPQEVTFPVRVMGELGIKVLIITNGVGAVNRSYRPGDIMIIRDHINMLFANPLVGPNIDELGPRFPDMTEAYDRQLIKLAHEAAKAIGIKAHEGVYWANLGPTYETPAEVEMAARLGGDVVGMSTVPECVVARHMKIRVLGLSQIGNMGAGITGDLIGEDHGAEGPTTRPDFKNLVVEILARLGSMGL
jgi:purine-nucleoside phosphorylase